MGAGYCRDLWSILFLIKLQEGNRWPGEEMQEASHDNGKCNQRIALFIAQNMPTTISELPTSLHN